MSLPGLFIVGTDTGVGKTRIASAIARRLLAEGQRVGVLKPVATGGVRVEGVWRSDDAERLLEAIGRQAPPEMVAPIVFEEPLAPVIAARRQGMPLEQADIEQSVEAAVRWWSKQAELLIVEGVGGLLCPLAEGTTVADLAVSLDYPLLIVARRGLGTLNHTLLTVEAALSRGLRLAGIVLNQTEPGAETLADATGADELARRLDGVPILAELAYHNDPANLAGAIDTVEWSERFRRPRFSIASKLVGASSARREA
jgi:dethiobiotin synthetase